MALRTLIVFALAGLALGCSAPPDPKTDPNSNANASQYKPEIGGPEGETGGGEGKK